MVLYKNILERVKIMIYLVRHGQTDWNLLKKFNGITETELNQTGINRAKYFNSNSCCKCKSNKLFLYWQAL
jgi:bisphosphoglycerate-dependent phosphoglycerate mutase